MGNERGRCEDKREKMWVRNLERENVEGEWVEGVSIGEEG